MIRSRKTLLVYRSNDLPRNKSATLIFYCYDKG